MRQRVFRLHCSVHEMHHVQHDGVALRVAKLLVIDEVPHICQDEARRKALQRVPWAAAVPGR